VKVHFVQAVLFLTAAFVSAAPLSVAGQDSGPVVVVVSGSQGPVQLVHEGKVLREEPSWGPYTAAVILAGPLDTVQWDGKAATLLSGGDDPEGVARQTLEGRTAPHLYFIRPDGSVEVLAAPDEPADGETAATAE